jgi:hypothetical protein
VTDFDAFWSYTHADDERTAGKVLKLAKMIGDEYFVSSGEEINIFVDRNSLEWGDLWREKIDRAIGVAPLFVAIVTPSFLKSNECRRELLAFSAQARSRGFQRLLLPILFAPIKDLREDSADEVIALIARSQYEDWTSLRLKDEGSAEVSAALNRLATRLIDLKAEAQTSATEVEVQEAEHPTQSADVVFDAITERLPKWLGAIEADVIDLRQWNALVAERMQRAERIEGHGKPGAVLATYVRMAKDIHPMAVNHRIRALEYHRLTIELDPIVTSAIRLTSRDEALVPLTSDLADGVQEAMRAIRDDSDLVYTAFPTRLLNYSSVLREAVELMRSANDYVDEANAIVKQWYDALCSAGILDPSDGTTTLIQNGGLVG